MARITDTSVEAVKAAADFVDVVSARTQLRKGGGGRFMGRCPFHEERTGSFSVNAVDKLYYCFGCGAKGDLITFVRETEGLDFVGAVEWLAERFRVPLEYEEVSPEQQQRRSRRERLLALLEQAAAFYERNLWESKAGAAAREYLESRNLGEPVCREFRLGLAVAGDVLSRKALEKGFTREELAAAGLSRRTGGDYFQRRLLFPLADARGRVLGFQARRLAEDDPLQAKYVNTAESELFRKGAIVYGLDHARASIAREDRALVVEGNTDVLALRQAGFEPVVACMGTALTEPQLKELRRLTGRLWLAFDGDAAGEAATLRGMALAAAHGFDVKVVALPPGGDPADEPASFADRLGSAQPYVVHRVQAEWNAAAGDREGAFRTIKAFLDAVPDSPERLDAWRKANDLLGTTMQLGRSRAAGGVAGPRERLIGAGRRMEETALAAVVAHRSLVRLLAELPAEEFDDDAHRRLRAHLVAGTALDDEAQGLYAELDARAAAEEIDVATGEESLLRLRERQLTRELRTAAPTEVIELQPILKRVRERLRNPTPAT